MTGHKASKTIPLMLLPQFPMFVSGGAKFGQLYACADPEIPSGWVVGGGPEKYILVIKVFHRGSYYFSSSRSSSSRGSYYFSSSRSPIASRGGPYQYF